MSDLVSVSKSIKLVNGSGGHGAISHLSGEMLKRAVGFNATHVPYKGNGPAIPDMMSGQAHLLINGIPDLLPAIKSGRVRAVAIIDVPWLRLNFRAAKVSSVRATVQRVRFPN